jgi:NTE family protein
VISALDIVEGRTTLFAELAPGVPFLPYAYPTRTLVTPITAERVLASTALPLLLPARSIDGRYYMDGALRFPTPIVPALRADAERIVVISLLHRPPGEEPETPLEYPGFVFLLGEIVSALLLDPVVNDLEHLLQTNQMHEILAETVDSSALLGTVRRLESSGILPAREIPTLFIRPSVDIAVLTSTFLREELDRTGLDLIGRALLCLAGRPKAGHQALLASILLLDGRLAARLVDLGRRDAHAASEQILAFFEGC